VSPPGRTGDDRIGGRVKGGRDVEQRINHAFNNDPGAARYDKVAATLARDRGIAFFDKTLKG
jgi:dienelactone hydrolase